MCRQNEFQLLSELLLKGCLEKEARYDAAPCVPVETSAADRKRNEKVMKERTTRFMSLPL